MHKVPLLGNFINQALRLIVPYFPRSTFYVRGRYLFDNTHNKVLLRGINLPLLDDWDFPASHNLPELEKTGANAVRIQWYIDYPNAPPPAPQRPAYDLTHLDGFLDECRQNRIIPILMLADCTCEPDTQLVNTKLVPWWTRADVVAVLNKHRKYLIINLGNEVGNYRWAGATVAALNAFKDAYKQAIVSIRNAGLQMPIMIDAPDCGTTIGAFTSIGQELIDHDPRRNILLSVHAYWAGYDGMTELNDLSLTKLPLIFGEIANKQAELVDGNLVQCHYDIDGKNENNPPSTGFKYQSLLASLSQLEIGWLAWSWWKDGCASRQITSSGKYANLTPYGNDIVNNGGYGLRLGYFRAVRTSTLPESPCCGHVIPVHTGQLLGAAQRNDDVGERSRTRQALHQTGQWRLI
jgi:mannan endo-1,4-beta-mannosidase